MINPSKICQYLISFLDYLALVHKNELKPNQTKLKCGFSQPAAGWVSMDNMLLRKLEIPHLFWWQLASSEHLLDKSVYTGTETKLIKLVWKKCFFVCCGWSNTCKPELCNFFPLK